jgi:DNA-directed RNA polymerase specialized sigma24 family protein
MVSVSRTGATTKCPDQLAPETRTTTSNEEAFTAFFIEQETRLRRALVAAYGGERGREAAAEALAFAWEHWDRVARMDKPLAYLFRVGQSRTRKHRTPVIFAHAENDAEAFEPGLAPAVKTLSINQRTAVVLVCGFGWTLREVAELTGTKIPTVQKHLDRGLANLRHALGERTNER